MATTEQVRYEIRSRVRQEDYPDPQDAVLALDEMLRKAVVRFQEGQAEAVPFYGPIVRKTTPAGDHWQKSVWMAVEAPRESVIGGKQDGSIA